MRGIINCTYVRFKMSKRIGETAIGIDLGTTYSCVAAWFHEHNRVEIIPNEQGNKITPSCVAWNGTRLLVGESAKNQISRNPNNTLFDVKRLMGNRFSDSRVQQDIKSWPFKVTEGHGEKPMVVFEHDSQEKKSYSPEEISSMILKNLKEAAEAYLGTTVTDAVITVPAYFSDKQRQATKDAGTLAGLNVMRLISEPTSAAIAYGLDKSAGVYCPKQKNVFVFDMGGGTFDVSLLNISKAGTITVKAVGGDTHLGGEDFDMEMVKYCARKFKDKVNKDVSENARSMMRLKVACEKAKRDLSSTTETSIEVDSLFEGTDFSMRISRARFEKMNGRFFEMCIEHVQNCLRDAKMHKDDVDDIVMVGGSTRIPKVQQRLMEYFDGKPLCKSISADEAVAYGAAVLAEKLSGTRNVVVQNLVLADVTPLSLGIWSSIEGLSSKQRDMSFVIPRNTPIPITRERLYRTTYDNQVHAHIKVYQGESIKTENNIFLDSFTLDGIPPGPARKQNFKVRFSIDANGILNVSAQVVSTGKKRSKRINNTGNKESKAIDCEGNRLIHLMKKMLS